MKKQAIWAIVTAVLLPFAVFGHADDKEWEVLYSSGFEKGEPKSLSKVYELVDDPAGDTAQKFVVERVIIGRHAVG